MTDDPRFKRVLKRYPKGEDRFDASMDVTGLGLPLLQEALSCRADDALMNPRQLDDRAISFLAARLGLEFDGGAYDFFLHVYVRKDCDDAYYKDPSPRTHTAPPEDGPPVKLLPKGMRWISVRPKDGKEQYVGVPAEDGGR
jgi:hypothetical protein